MLPNETDSPIDRDPEIVHNATDNGKQTLPESKDDYILNIFQSSFNQLSHILIGIIVGVSLLFALRDGFPTDATSQHVILCVLGYQLLMGQAILSLSPHNGWSSRLKLVHKRRAHWILQVLGSSLTLAGCHIQVVDKGVYWNTMSHTFHGMFAQLSMVFSVVSLANGLTSLYANELSKFRVPPSLSKLTHICFGIVGFSTASIALCFGLDRIEFRSWASDSFTTAMIIFVAIFTTIIIINPFISFYNKSRVLFKNN
ncbi:uncharacterized protein LOC134653280 [Cydia amplana]|uniref:uncharacterized protein LOC134653280 n=1 Tax=Cydia amplana TaxID=1869771 RepID=UPI002FE56DAF